MTTKGQFLLLGTGGSMGIPVIGCSCPVCSSDNPINRRTRPSALIKINQKLILIDCGPDFKEQALRFGLDTLDSVIFTHAHHDHSAGLDELRIYSLRSGHPIPCLLSSDTLEEFRKSFHYIFDENSAYSPFTTKFTLQLLESQRGETVFQGINIRYFSYKQGGMHVNGFRFANLAYVTDIRDYPETVFEDLRGVDTLILSALRFAPSHLHLTVDDAIDFARRVGAKHTWLTHIAHELDHDKTNAYLPENIKMAYDGLELEFHQL